MKNIFTFLIISILMLLTCSMKAKENDEIKPIAVTKDSKQKVYMHMMTWFETKETNRHPDPQYAGKWGNHWTMSTKNPDIIVDAATGRREIATYYYPLTGPYASGDKNIIEYQLLLMKLAGVDGIIFDYTTLNPAWDFPMLVANTDSIERQTKKIGLDFCILYEDQHLRDAAGRNELTDKPVDRAKKDMEYIKTRYLNEPNYIHVDGKPLLLDFGPQTFEKEAEWTDIFSVFGEKQPAFYTLWYQSADAGKNAYGEYAWIWKDYLAGLRHFYNTYSYSGHKIGVAYPGFVDFYKEGNWGDGIGWQIAHRGDSTLTETLRLAMNSNVDFIQLATWNDYGEGTMFEPTVEFGFTFLATLQKELGVKNLSQQDLELVFDLYQARVKYAKSDKIQKKLDKASEYIASLQIDKAKKILVNFSK